MKKITLLLLLCISVFHLSAQTFGKPRVNRDQKTTASPKIISPSTTMVETQSGGHPSGIASSSSSILFKKSSRSLLTAPGNECTGAVNLSPTVIPTCASIATTPTPTANAGASGQISGTGTTATSSTTTPFPASGCGFYPGYTPDVWYSVTIPAGGGGFQILTDVSVAAGTTAFYGTTTTSSLIAQVYSGTCTSLTPVGGCTVVADYYNTAGTCTAPSAFALLDGTNGLVGSWTGLAPGTYYIRLYSYRERQCVAQTGTAPNNFVQDNWFLADFSISLLPPPPANESCNACTPNATSGCNLGAPAESNWSGPSASTTATPPGAGITCNGNSWSSVDNPVYFCFTATTANPTITVNGIACNGGSTNSAAQFAAFSSCASITGTAAMWNSTNFFGCSAGNGTVNLNTTGIAAGQSFIVVVDGTAGDNCVWNFQNAGVLPLEMMNFAGYKEKSANILNWTTANEVNNDHFMVEKSLDGTKYETLGKVSSTAKGNQKQSYSFSDERPNSGITYYKLKQVGTDGGESYSQVISVTRKDEKFAIHNLFPSPAVQSMTLEFESVATAPVEARIIDSYGRMLKNFRIESVRNGINYFQIDELSDLSQGMYFLQLSNGSEQILQRFIKN